MEEQRTNNSVELIGTLDGQITFSHRSRDEDYFMLPLRVERLSGTADTANITIRESLLKRTELIDGEKVYVRGELRSFNNKSGKGSKLIISVFAHELGFTDSDDKNDVKLTGTICKAPNFRKTPMGREICDLMIAVNRRYERSDYLPCICWGNTAAETSTWPIGAFITIDGRLQSRKYIKVEDNVSTEKIAYEVSVIKAKLI
jgi:single-strand DNA-binding protein